MTTLDATNPAISRAPSPHVLDHLNEKDADANALFFTTATHPHFLPTLKMNERAGHAMTTSSVMLDHAHSFVEHVRYSKAASYAGELDYVDPKEESNIRCVMEPCKETTKRDSHGLAIQSVFNRIVIVAQTRKRIHNQYVVSKIGIFQCLNALGASLNKFLTEMHEGGDHLFLKLVSGLGESSEHWKGLLSYLSSEDFLRRFPKTQELSRDLNPYHYTTRHAILYAPLHRQRWSFFLAYHLKLRINVQISPAGVITYQKTSVMPDWTTGITYVFPFLHNLDSYKSEVTRLMQQHRKENPDSTGATAKAEVEQMYLRTYSSFQKASENLDADQYCTLRNIVQQQFKICLDAFAITSREEFLIGLTESFLKNVYMKEIIRILSQSNSTQVTGFFSIVEAVSKSRKIHAQTKANLEHNMKTVRAKLAASASKAQKEV